MGLRVCGTVTAAAGMTPDGIAEALPSGEAGQGCPEYVLTGAPRRGETSGPTMGDGKAVNPWVRSSS